MAKANYLLEIGTEEIPAKFMPGALSQLAQLAKDRLKEWRIGYGSIRAMGTPRRLALLAYDLAEKGEDVEEEVRGPSKKAAFDPAGKPTKAAEGFARSQGVPVDSLILKDSGNGEYLYAKKKLEGKRTVEILPALALQLVTGLSFPKPMRWGNKDMRYARPIRWLVSLLDDEVVSFEVEGLPADRYTRGHRILGEDKISINNPLTYEKQLQENFVLVDQDIRRAESWRQIQEIAGAAGGAVEPDEELLEEVTFLLEWPTALMGTFEPYYLEIPEEVVITPMREHQRYFPVKDKTGKLMNRFITVRNGTADYLDIVRAGNEKVLQARLADARFFWEEDQKIKLEDYLPRLEKIVFQESLGTMAQKTERIQANVKYLAERLKLDEETKSYALRASLLAKADLVTSMVYEFPELQGIMGRYYALKSGERAEVARAILEHYQPRFAGDEIPAGLAGALVSLADKLDTIAGCFAIGIEPTGSQDPYALRRQAMGICQILLGQGLELSLTEIVDVALKNYRGIRSDAELGPSTLGKIMEFFQPRLKNILSDEGHRYDVVEAVLGVDNKSVLLALARARALSRLKDTQDFQTLLTAFTRAYNLSKKAGDTPIDPASFVEQVENQLYQALTAASVDVALLAGKSDFEALVTRLAGLAEPINRFFDAVMIMVEDEKVRANRLGLLARFVELTGQVGDLSKIVP